jgi:leucyl aminopeptidase (aminopeptidase T)
MNLTLGTELNQEYYAFELMAAARKFLSEIMLVRPGEEVLTTIDTAADWRVAIAISQAAATLNARPTLLLYETLPEPQMEPPAVVAGAVAKADVWVDLAVQYILYTKARETATKNGCRHASMSCIDVDTLVRMVGKVNIGKMLGLGDELVRLLNQAKEIRVTSREGTDLIGQLTGDAFQAGGIATEKGALIMLGGQVGHLPPEDTLHGKIVVDGEIWPPKEIGVLEEPVELTIEKGAIRQVKGGKAATTYEQWLASYSDPNLYYMAHYAYGFNPGVSRLSGRITEDERIFGSITFGFGTSAVRKAASHTDCIVLRPTVLLDGIAIEQDGKYVNPSLAHLCKEMKVPGY